MTVHLRQLAALLLLTFAFVDGAAAARPGTFPAYSFSGPVTVPGNRIQLGRATVTVTPQGNFSAQATLFGTTVRGVGTVAADGSFSGTLTATGNVNLTVPVSGRISRDATGWLATVTVEYQGASHTFKLRPPAGKVPTGRNRI
jgi:hypothetical protein